MIFRLGTAAAALLLLVLLPGRAQAHPFALSGFEVWAGEQDLRVEFRLDAPAVLAELNRAYPERNDSNVSAIVGQEAGVLAYVGAHIKIGNGGHPCPQQPAGPGAVLLHEGIAKVLFELRFVCPTPLDALTIESTLFNQQRPAPQVLCAFHFKRALEHYFFSVGIPLANIPVRALGQVLPTTLGDSSESRAADRVQPPEGAFANSVPAKPKATGASAGARGSLSFFAFAWQFLAQGIEHILGGIDHLLFVVALVISVRSRRELILIVTSFTLAHSITLILGTFALVTASPRLVEPLIAASIVYVAVENIVRAAPPARPVITFGFGLIHGLGFSEALRELGLAPRALVAPLIGFNLGVEIGQLAIVLPLLPLVLWLRQPARAEYFRRASAVVNSAVAAIATAWFFQRLFGW